MFKENRIIGILGGGQLGKMVLDVANKWGLQIYILDSNENCPASKLCSKFFQGDLMDFDTVVNFGKVVDILTIEIENVNVEALKFLELNGLEVLPQSKVIEIIQDKSLQKEFYYNNQIPTSSYRILKGKNELKESVSKGEISLPFIWKASRMGYDGFGVNKISNNKDLEKIDDCPCIVEELISIKKELSVMVASRKSGELINYPVVEMEFNSDSNQVEYILSPAKINDDIKLNAEGLAIEVAKKYIKTENFITSVNYIKKSQNNNFIQVNSGFNHFLRPTLYNSYHEVINLSNPNDQKEECTIVGYICEKDTLAEKRIISKISKGDLLCFKNAGAYGYNMSSNYNSRLRPAELCIHDNSIKKIREKENLEDLLKNQIDIF